MDGTEGRYGSFGEQMSFHCQESNRGSSVTHFVTQSLQQLRYSSAPNVALNVSRAEKAVNVLKSQMTEIYTGWGLRRRETKQKVTNNREINPLNADLNPICHLLALLGSYHILNISRIRVKQT